MTDYILKFGFCRLKGQKVPWRAPWERGSVPPPTHPVPPNLNMVRLHTPWASSFARTFPEDSIRVRDLFTTTQWTLRRKQSQNSTHNQASRHETEETESGRVSGAFLPWVPLGTEGDKGHFKTKEISSSGGQNKPRQLGS